MTRNCRANRDVIPVGLPGRQSGQDERVGYVLAINPVKVPQAIQILEELIYQNGRGLPQGAGQELRRKQAPVPPLRRD